MTLPLLSSVLFLPLLGAIVLAGFPRERANALRWGALVVMLVTFAVSLALYPLFDSTLPGMQLSERVPWIAASVSPITSGWMVSACPWCF